MMRRPADDFFGAVAGAARAVSCIVNMPPLSTMMIMSDEPR
jgi:hypothetical protein